MFEFVIEYKNRQRKTVKAKSYKIEGAFFAFRDDEAPAPILTIPTDSVASIERVDSAA